MFGFSIMKVLVTIAVVVVVWQGFKWLNRRNALNQRRAEEMPREKPQSTRRAEVEDMVQCPDCGAYVPQGSRHDCG